MKSNDSKLLKNMRTTYFNSISSNPDKRQGPYSKTIDKISMLEFELERHRDTIIHLRAELANKNKEISLLKVNNNKKSEEYHKAMRVMEEILKQCDQSTTSGFNVIEKSVLNMDLSNNDNNANNSNTVNVNKMSNSVKKTKKINPKLPQIGNLLHFTTKHKKTMKDMVYVSMLKNQITNLNEELVKKDETINELKKNKNSTKFSLLKNNFLKNYNELTQVKKENEFMKTKIEDVHHLLIAEKEDNLILKNKLQDFQDQYYIYKDNTTKKTNALENMLAKMRTKERECKIFHVRKGASPLNIRPKKREFGGSILEEKNENELDNNEIKGMNKTTSEIKIAKINQENQIKILQKEKNDLIEEFKKIEKEKKLFSEKIENMSKQIKEETNKRINAEKNIKEQATDANKIIENLEKENKELKESNSKLKSELDEEKNKNNDMNKLVKEKENENQKLNKKIEELEKKIEELQNELINYKDDMFLTNVGIKKTPHDLEKDNNIQNKIEENNKNEEKEELKASNQNINKDKDIKKDKDEDKEKQLEKLEKKSEQSETSIKLIRKKLEYSTNSQKEKINDNKLNSNNANYVSPQNVKIKINTNKKSEKSSKIDKIKNELDKKPNSEVNKIRKSEILLNNTRQKLEQNLDIKSKEKLSKIDEIQKSEEKKSKLNVNKNLLADKIQENEKNLDKIVSPDKNKNIKDNINDSLNNEELNPDDIKEEIINEN